MIKTLCYISTISPSTTKNDINILSRSVPKKNKNHNITGILIIHNGHFFQIMEGEEAIVENIYKKIEVDKRHSGIIKLLETKIDYRVFEDYSSNSFSVINDFSNLKKLKIYFDWIKNANILAVDELITLTNNFLKYSS